MPARPRRPRPFRSPASVRSRARSSASGWPGCPWKRFRPPRPWRRWPGRYSPRPSRCTAPGGHRDLAEVLTGRLAVDGERPVAEIRAERGGYGGRRVRIVVGDRVVVVELEAGRLRGAGRGTFALYDPIDRVHDRRARRLAERADVELKHCVVGDDVALRPGLNLPDGQYGELPGRRPRGRRWTGAARRSSTRARPDRRRAVASTRGCRGPTRSRACCRR